MTVQPLSGPVEPIPASHQIGDPGHTPDHNSMVQVLTDYDGDIGVLQGQIANMFSLAGGNVCTIAGTTTSLATVNLPSGNRDTAADTFDVYCAGVKVFSLNGYGELRIIPALATHIGQVIRAQVGQTADLFQITDQAGNILVRISSTGQIVTSQPAVIAQPGISPIIAEVSHNMPSMTSSWSIADFARYRLNSDGDLQVAFKNIRCPGGTNANDGTVLWAAGSFPTAYRVPTFHLIPCVADSVRMGGTNPEASALSFNPDGSVTCQGIASNANRVDLYATVPLWA